MGKEIWKDINEYENIYQISNLGRVKSVKKGIIKKPSVLPRGYLRIGLSKCGKVKYYSIHRLVAEAFIPNPFNKPCVNHKDCNTSNNNVDNLEWCTWEENSEYGDRKLKVALGIALYHLKTNHPKETKIINKLVEIQKYIKKLN